MKKIADIGMEVLETDMRAIEPEEALFLLALIELELRGEDPPDDDAELGYQIMKKRLEVMCPGRQIATDHLIYFMSLLADRPGAAMLLLAMVMAMHAKRRKSGDAPLTLVEAFTTHLHNAKIPSEDGLRKVWEGQKIGGKNAVDASECWA